MKATSIPSADTAPLWPALERDHKPWTRWWWHGSAVDERNLTRELKALRDAGFGGVEITPIYGVQGEEARHVPFLSDRWLALMRHACQEARRLGLGVDIIPGTGWRLGGPEVPRRERSVVLRLRRAHSKDGPGVMPVAALSGEPIKRPAPGGEGHSIDLFDRRAVANHFDRFNRRFFAAVPAELVRAQFHDSWEYVTDWSHRLLDEFVRRRGYDLRDYASAFDPEVCALPRRTVGRVLYDYRLTVEELLLEHFTGPWAERCHARGLLARNQAHGSPGNLLDIYAQADIPETEVIWDPINPLIQKFASSAGHVAGRPMVSAEAYTWLSDHWRSDLGKVKRYTDYLFLCGINHIVCHGTAYSPSEAAWPGWVFYASTQVNARNPLWRDWPVLNAYIARCQSLLQSGTPDERVLVYWPLADLTMEPGGRLRHFCIRGDSWAYGEPLRETAQALWDRGVPFDYVSDRQLAQARGVGRQAQTPGGAYRAVVLPPLRYLPEGTAEALRRLAEAGVPIVAMGSPDAWDVPGRHSLVSRRRALRRAVALLQRAPSFVVSADPASVLGDESFGAEPMQVGTGLRCLRRRLPTGNALYFVVNRGNERFDGWVQPSETGDHGILRDPWTGAVGRVRRARRGFRLQLEAQQSVFLEVSQEQPVHEVWTYAPAPGPDLHEVKGPWKLSFVAGGPTRPQPLRCEQLGSITALGVPTLERFGGTIRYETTFDLPQAQFEARWLELGRVCHSARVTLNGQELGVLVQAPFRMALPSGCVRLKGNLLVVEVTTLGANRIRDLDRRGVPWKIFHDINIVNDRYQPFDASSWELLDEGLLGPVALRG